MAQDIPLPDRWKWTTIGEITLPIEKVFPQKKHIKRFTYLDISSIDNKIHKIVEPKIYLGVEAPSRARQLVRANDILFSTVRTYLENIALVPDIFDGQIASTGFAVLRANYAVLPKLLFYYCLSNRFLEPLNELQRGTSYPAVRDGDVRVQPIPLPPLAEQERIVAKIEELFTQLEAGTAALRRIQAGLKRYKASVLKSACEGRLVPQDPSDEPAEGLLHRLQESHLVTEDLPFIPRGWCWSKIDPFLSRTRTGLKTGPFGSLLKKHEHRETGIPILGIENIDAMKFLRGSKIHITKEKAKQLVGYAAMTGDILISRSGTVGEVCVVPDNFGEARISTNVMRVVLNQDVMSPDFFVMLFNGSPYVLDQVTELCKGSTRAFLNQSILKSIIFPLPPLLEQQRIVVEVERRLSVAIEVEAALEAALARSVRLRQAILKRAFEGRLVGHNPV